MRSNGICWVGVCIIALGMAFGAQGEEAAASYRLNTMEVRARMGTLLAPTSESAALDFVTDRITEEELRRVMPVSASGALAAAPGIHTETRGRKYKQFHSFRGQLYPYPDVVFDGIWQREAQELLYVFPGAMIEHVEIIRSPFTLFHGLSDVVGVINITPRQPKLESAGPGVTTLGVEGGSEGTFRTYGFHDIQSGANQALTVGGQYYHTDGPSGRNAAEKMSSAFASYLYQPDPDHRLSVGAWVLHGYRELEMPDPDGPASNNLKNRKEIYDPITYSHINLQGFHRWSERTTTDWKTFYSDRQARYKRTKINPGLPGPGDTTDDEDDREYGAQIIQGLAVTPKNTLRLGVFAHRWTAPDGKQSYAGSRQDVSSYALVLADEHIVGNWTLDAGVRYARSYFHNFSGPAFDLTGQSTQLLRTENEWDDAVLSGTMGAVWALTERSRLYAYAGIGERRPGPGAVMSDGSSPDTEQRYTADGGWATSWGANQSGLLKLGGFGVWRKDAIVRINETGVDESGVEFYFSGNRDIRQSGMELAVRTPALWEDHLYFFGNITWMRSEEKIDGSYGKYREIPSLNVTLGMQLDIGIWDAGLTVKHVDDYENFRFAQDGEYHDLGDYWDVTLSVGARVGRDKNIRLYALVENTLDDTYSTVVGWKDSGRRYRAGVQATF